MTEKKTKLSFTTTSTPAVAPAEGVLTNDLKAAPQQEMRQKVRISTPVEKKVPDAPEFAVAGLMSNPSPSFLSRNAQLIGFAAVACVTFVLGLATASIFLGDPEEGEIAELATPMIAMPKNAGSFDQIGNDAATRAASPDLTNISGAMVVSSSQASSVNDLATAVDAGLKPGRSIKLAMGDLTENTAQSMDILTVNKLRMLREGVLAGAYQIVTVEVNGHDRVRLQTVNVRATSDFMALTLEKAAEDGRIAMSASLRTPDGSVDTDTMIFNLVQNSLLRDKSRENAAAAHEMSRKVFAASNARTSEKDGRRIYTVRTGDSLAYISLQFYGMPSAYKRILEANPDTLQSPDRIQVGQRLIIPS